MVPPVQLGLIIFIFVGTLGNTQINLAQKPRGLPEGDLAKVYKTKSGHYALNINLASGI